MMMMRMRSAGITFSARSAHLSTLQSWSPQQLRGILLASSSSPANRYSTPLLYKDKPEWQDITPIYNSAEENAVIRIATSGECSVDNAFAYLRSVMNVNELSERALGLTQTCISHNAANYSQSVWQYRRAILRALKKDYAEELRFCEEVIMENPKNYQVWHHRKTLVDESGDHSAELDFTARQLQEEPQNYHAWKHRSWVVERFGLFSQRELDFAAQCLFEDVRNSLAWNYRYRIGAQLSECFANKEFLEREIAFALDCIKKSPGNESPWSYLAGILINDTTGPNRPEIDQFCRPLLAREPPCNSPHLYQFLIDKICDKLREPGAANDGQRLDVLASTGKEYLDVSECIDPIRRNLLRFALPNSPAKIAIMPKRGLCDSKCATKEPFTPTMVATPLPDLVKLISKEAHNQTMWPMYSALFLIVTSLVGFILTCVIFFYQLFTRMGKMESRIGNMESRIGNMESRIGNMESRIGNMESAILQIDTKVDNLTKSLCASADHNVSSGKKQRLKR